MEDGDFSCGTDPRDGDPVHFHVSRRSQKRVVSVGAAGVLLLTGLSACSGSSESSSSGAGCVAPGVSEDEIEIGFVYPITGFGAEAFSSARGGIDARLGLVNEQGGVHGREVVYTWRDDASDLAAGARATRELVETENVFGLVTSSAVLGDSVQYLDDQAVPVVGMVAESVWAEHPNMISYTYTLPVSVVGLYTASQGGTDAAVVLAEDSGAVAAFGATAQDALSAAGVRLVGASVYTAGSDSADRVAQEVAATGANALLSVLEPEPLAEVLNALHRLGVQLDVTIALTGYDANALEQFGSALAGVSVPVTFRPFEAGGPSIDRFQSAMTRYAPHVQPREQQFAMQTYIYTDIFLRGLEAAGECPDREAFVRAVRGLNDYTADGLIEKTDLGANIGKPIACIAFVRVDPAGQSFDVVNERVCENSVSG